MHIVSSKFENVQSEILNRILITRLSLNNKKEISYFQFRFSKLLNFSKVIYVQIFTILTIAKLLIFTCLYSNKILMHKVPLEIVSMYYKIEIKINKRFNRKFNLIQSLFIFNVK